MNKRHTETKYYLTLALVSLLSEKDFEAITISDLAKRAGINRGTFYLHYKDKYQMIDQIKEESLEHIFKILDQQAIYTDTRALLIAVLTLFQGNFSFVQALSKSSYVNFKQTLKDFIFRVLLSIKDYQTIVSKQYGIPYEYALEVYLSSIESIISYWVANGGKESPEQLSDIILKTVSVEK
ncbi:TetR/AcrR family transcriptional regulator [Streptococcus didelphis]|uniref:TetR/AcrR family transcriptional regulator n=1 Tax=Streptococcus didelphis TaxID=102886 RepID=A0ABY9LHD6_9STRE|nr:TetR/AcrR family transcriptional regulator [Streptococcus didelphis]WMB28234.1 TetR/AcrR family transcriptional regulator [Streptococcus didelphis]WMB28908.1 TetR/AcrR family transcriptional regulator [Streptococcus didelphis]